MFGRVYPNATSGAKSAMYDCPVTIADNASHCPVVDTYNLVKQKERGKSEQKHHNGSNEVINR